MKKKTDDIVVWMIEDRPILIKEQIETFKAIISYYNSIEDSELFEKFHIDDSVENEMKISVVNEKSIIFRFQRVVISDSELVKTEAKLLQKELDANKKLGGTNLLVVDISLNPRSSKQMYGLDLARELAQKNKVILTTANKKVINTFGLTMIRRAVVDDDRMNNDWPNNTAFEKAEEIIYDTSKSKYCILSKKLIETEFLNNQYFGYILYRAIKG